MIKQQQDKIVICKAQKDDFDNILVYASIFDPTGKDKTLYPIETEEEWDVIETIFSKLPDVTKEEN